MTPKAPGKLTFTATSAAGSGAKYSGTVEFYGNTRKVDITVPETIPAGSKPVPLTVKAYYDNGETKQIAKPNLYWDVVELRKIDNSWFTESRIYYVWATSEDGCGESNVLEIQAYAMTGAIQIASVDGWTDYLNNRKITIQQGETLNLKALVSDVAGYGGANPDVTWSISGKKGIVEKLYDAIDGYTDVLELKGLKPGTVTVKATAIDGSKKTATFKLVVEPSAQQ